MIVVSDASPLIALAVIDQLDLLRKLYGRVLIPEAVYREAAEASPHAPGVSAVQSADWLVVEKVRDPARLEELVLELDDGEAAAIALALETKADLLLMDERRGRAAATRFGINVVGVLGVLIEAKQQRLIPLIEPSLDLLQRRAGFHMSGELVSRILEVAGE